MKKESSPANIPVSSVTPERDPTSGSPRGRKRPRRSTAITVRSYVVPGSDDEAIAVEDDEDYDVKMKQTEGNLRLWVKHLGELLKTEQAKVCVAEVCAEITCSRILTASRAQEKTHEGGRTRCKDPCV